MKKIILISLFLIAIILRLQAQNPCIDPANYVPNNPDHSPIKKVRVVIHVMQNSADTGNFKDTQADKQNLFPTILLKTTNPSKTFLTLHKIPTL